MAKSVIQSASVALSDDYAFTGTVSGAGKILQVVTHIETDFTYYAYASDTDVLLIASNANDSTSHVSVSITPSATTSKILLQASLFYESSNPNNQELLWAFHRNSTRLGAATTGSRRGGIAINAVGHSSPNAASTPDSANILFVDTPSTTSAITYAVGFNASHSAHLHLNKSKEDSDSIAHERGNSIIIATEIAG